MYINNYNRVFSVRFLWDISQPFVCGTLEEIVEYAIKNSEKQIDYFYEISYHKIRKVTKKELKNSYLDDSLKSELFKRY